MTKKVLLTIFIASLIIGWQLLRPGYYSMHDDLQVMRLFEMNKCFENGQIPCRWVSDLGQNYGQPLFNFYSALPYYLGQAFHLVGFTFVDTVKLLFFLSLFFSGVFVYLFSKEFLKERTSLVVAFAYMTAPYHAVDIFVRGALSESWGLTLVPLVLYSVVRLCREPKTSNGVKLSLSLAALLITHNITLLISAPIILSFGLFFFIKNRNQSKQLKFLVPSIILGIGLSAFFLFPVLLEQKYIQTKFLVSDYFDFRAHFATLSQLFVKLSWGYGPSRFNSYQYPETLSFFVGIVTGFSLLISPFLVFLSFKRRSKNFNLFFMTMVLAGSVLFMTHSKSFFIWEKISALEFIQFPWRFLGPTALLSSILVGFCLESVFVTDYSLKLSSILFAVILIAANFPYFKFEKYYPDMNDAKKLSGAEYDIQIRGALLDYLPSTVKVIPESKAPSSPQILTGEAGINYFDKRSNYFSSEFDVQTTEAVVQFPVMDFPGWTLYQNRNGVPIKFENDNNFGLITVKLNKGHQLIQAFFEDTFVRRISNILTIASGLLLTIWVIVSHQTEDEK